MSYIIDSETLRDLIKTGQKALKGDSNDAEHDALYEIVITLETIRAQEEKEIQACGCEKPVILDPHRIVTREKLILAGLFLSTRLTGGLAMLT